MLGGDWNNEPTLNYLPTGISDESQIWNIARSPIDLQRDFAKSLTGSETGLAGYWKFNEGSGTTIADHDRQRQQRHARRLHRPHRAGLRRTCPGARHGQVARSSTATTTTSTWATPRTTRSTSAPMRRSRRGCSSTRLPRAGSPPSRARTSGSGTNNKWIFGYSNNYSGNGTATIFHINTTSSGSIFLKSNPWTPTPGTWYDLAVVKSGNNYTFYLNGVANGTATTTIAVPDVAATFQVGPGGGELYFNGQIDDLRLWNTAQFRGADLGQHEHGLDRHGVRAGRLLEIRRRRDQPHHGRLQPQRQQRRARRARRHGGPRLDRSGAPQPRRRASVRRHQRLRANSGQRHRPPRLRA